MASLKHLIAAGPARILGPIYAENFITINGTASQFIKGNGTLGTYVNILTGSSAPTSSQGSNGDIYIKTTT